MRMKAILTLRAQLGGEAAEAGYSIVSGGARGIDESAMLGALEKEGTVIGVLSDRLLKAATSSKYRPALMARNLVLMSPFNPEAGFDVGNAMARNKYVLLPGGCGRSRSLGNQRWHLERRIGKPQTRLGAVVGEADG